MMKKCVVFGLLVFGCFCAGTQAFAAAPTAVDVLYMNHGPLQETLGKMRMIFSGFGDRVTVSWYDFESKEGEKFMAGKGIKQHIPLVIWIEGKQKWSITAKEVTFSGFPTGSGPAFFQGKWTLDDLKAALDQAVGKR
jgi:hypothetical protein